MEKWIDMDPTSWTYNTEKTGEVKCYKPRNFIYLCHKTEQCTQTQAYD